MVEDTCLTMFSIFKTGLDLKIWYIPFGTGWIMIWDDMGMAIIDHLTSKFQMVTYDTCMWMYQRVLT